MSEKGFPWEELQESAEKTGNFLAHVLAHTELTSEFKAYRIEINFQAKRYRSEIIAVNVKVELTERK